MFSSANQQPGYKAALQETVWTNPRRRWPLRQKSTWSSRGTEGKQGKNLATLQAHSKNVIHSKTTVSDLKTLQRELETAGNMSSTLAPPTFNWKSSDQIRAWETFKAKAELWLEGEKVDPTIQYTKIVLMLGYEGLSRWKKFNMSDEDKKVPEKVFKEFRDSFGKDVSYRTAEQHSTKISDSIRMKTSQNLTYDYPA